MCLQSITCYGYFAFADSEGDLLPVRLMSTRDVITETTMNSVRISPHFRKDRALYDARAAPTRNALSQPERGSRAVHPDAIFGAGGDQQVGHEHIIGRLVRLSSAPRGLRGIAWK